MKRRHLISLMVVAVVAFLAFCGVVFSQSLTPYVSFAEAMEKNSTVQVRGILTGAVNPTNEGRGITFELTDGEGTSVAVIYPGAKPENLEHSESVVVVGRYQDQVFKAEKILVKCPSKYQTKENR